MTTTLTRGGLLAAAGAGALALAIPSRGLAAAAGEERGLPLLLAVEHLQAALYGAAERAGLGDEATHLARTLGAVERAHVAELTALLGDAAAPPPEFDLEMATAGDEMFLAIASAVEEIGAAAYAQTVARLADPGTVARLAALHTVEASHAAWLRIAAGVVPAPRARDRALPADRAVRLLVDSGLLRPREGSIVPLTAGRPRPPAPAVLFRAHPLRTASSATYVPDALPRHDAGHDLPPWTGPAAAGAGTAAVALTALGVRARRQAVRRGTVVGAHEGPPVSQRARPRPPEPGSG